MATPLIEFIDVHKRFGRTKVLDGVNLTIERGETTTIIGKSGVGKSVLLKHVIGLLEPDSGEIRFEGRDITHMSRAERREVKRKFSYMFQNMALFDSMTVYENIALPLAEKTRMSERDIRAKVMDNISQLELGEISNKYPSQISGGMKKRVAFARALITDPEIVLFDEPTTGLDPLRKNAVFSLIAHYQRKFGYTAVVVSHDIPDVFYISQRVAMIDEGKILFQGPPEDIQHSEFPVVQDFIHSLEALKDELTGMDTKKRLSHRFQHEIYRAGYSQERFSVIVFRLADMDRLSDRLGHTAAQRLIRNFARILKANLRPFDISARYTRDQILTVLPATQRDQAEEICARVAAAIREEGLLAGIEDTVSYSILAGIAEAGPESQAEDVVGQAEATLVDLASFQNRQRAES